MHYFARFAVIFSLLASTAVAQGSRVGGTIDGTVTDTSGGRIPDVNLQLVEASTNLIRNIHSDESGLFRATDLPAGTYDIRADRDGLAPYLQKGIFLEVGADIHLDIVLHPASATANVTVTGQPSALEATETSITSRVDRERIEELPVESRNALDFVLIEPAVAQSPDGQGGSPHAALGDSGFNFGGLRARSNSVSIDGLDNNDEFSGSSRTEMSPEIVQEYQVVHNGLSAEFGGASGGSINVVTRAGGNTTHGDAFIFLQDAATNARDPFEVQAAKPSFRRYRGGFAIGGPIVKSRTFYYAAVEQEHNRGQAGNDIDPAGTAAINTFLATGAFSALTTRRITTGLFPISQEETEASGKVDHQINGRNSLMVRYTFTNNRLPGDGFNTSGLEDASARGSRFTADNALSGSLVSTYGLNAVGDLRVEAATRHEVLRTGDTTGPGIQISGLADFGRPYAGNSIRRENHYEGAYTYSRVRGAHLWKIGGTVNRVREQADVPDGFGGFYNFDGLSNFFAASPNMYVQGFGNPSTNYAVTSYGAFVQDHWTPLSHVTLDIGVRYDFEHLPSQFHEGTRNFSPRIGLAYSPSKSWVMRAGYGIFFDRYVLANLNRAMEIDGVNAFEQVADGAAATSAFQANVAGISAGILPAIAPSVYRPDPRMGTPYSQQASAGAQYLIAHNLTVSVDYLFVHGVKLPRTRNVNLLPPVVLTAQNGASLGVPNPTPQQIGREVFGSERANPRFNAINQIEDSSSSTYNGVTVSLNRRMANEFEFLGTYTFSKTIDDASDFFEQPQNSFNPRAERALSLQDQRHRFVFDALWDLPIGPDEDDPQPTTGPVKLTWVDQIFGHIEVAPIFTVGSGRPVNALAGTDANLGNIFPLSARPLGLSRNSLQTSHTEQLDFRILKYFPFGEFAHLDLVAEAFNLFNHPNVAQINPYFGTGAGPSPVFAQPIQSLGARRIEFSIDFEY